MKTALVRPELPRQPHRGTCDLRDRTILLISPQAWDHIAVSKHHYAIELARRGNRVYFLEPPHPTGSRSVSLRPSDHAGLTVVRFRPRFPGALRFHARALFDRLMRAECSRISAAIRRPIDIVWSFESNLYADLRSFGGALTIFHPVDPLPRPEQVRPAASADAVFSVSHDILDTVRSLTDRSWFLNHALSTDFARIATRSSPEAPRTTGRLRVGYVGNLLHPSLDRAIFRQIVTGMPGVEFHVWGPCAGTTLDEDRATFVRFMRDAANVRLHGPTPSAQLAEGIQGVDAFLLAYRHGASTYDSSNSHKLLEYLSTGKVVVSSRLSVYADRRDLLVMPQDGDNRHLPRLLTKALADLATHNAPDRVAHRRNFALEHTYARQLDRVAHVLGSLDTLPERIARPRGDR
ncbi:MAG TPA: hypothetical protein VFO55_11035 [Gemmatimonadaceae bacterium]|nr:hypothetical protein [Gemmatimonadaceae bacterium]